MENVPATGGALMVSNHSGGLIAMDVPVLAVAFFDEFGSERPLYVLAHDVLFLGASGPVMRRAGFLPATRENADAVLRSGGVTIVFPGGDHDVFRPSSEAHQIDFDGRKGYVRTALRAGVPIVPVGEHRRPRGPDPPGPRRVAGPSCSDWRSSCARSTSRSRSGSRSASRWPSRRTCRSDEDPHAGARADRHRGRVRPRPRHRRGGRGRAGADADALNELEAGPALPGAGMRRLRAAPWRRRPAALDAARARLQRDDRADAAGQVPPPGRGHAPPGHERDDRHQPLGRAQPERRPALVDERGSLTWRELDRRSDARPWRCSELPGDRSGTLGDPVPQPPRAGGEPRRGSRSAPTRLLLNTGFSAPQLADVLEREQRQPDGLRRGVRAAARGGPRPGRRPGRGGRAGRTTVRDPRRRPTRSTSSSTATAASSPAAPQRRAGRAADVGHHRYAEGRPTAAAGRRASSPRCWSGSRGAAGRPPSSRRRCSTPGASASW